MAPSHSPPAIMRANLARAIKGVLVDNRTIDWITDHHSDWINTPEANALLYGTLRHYFSLSQCIDKALSRPLRRKDLDVYALMLVGAYQLFHSETTAYAAINEAVDASSALRKPWGKALINAVLRNIKEPNRSFDHPQWLVEQIKAQHPSNGADILFANNTRAPMALRVNQAKLAVEDYAQKLTNQNISHRLGAVAGSVILQSPQASATLPGWAAGEVAVQDMGAQLVASQFKQLLDHRGDDATSPLHVLDACTAPGGKLAHLLEAAALTPNQILDIVGLELSPSRLAHVEESLTRLGHPTTSTGTATQTQTQLMCADATELDWWNKLPFEFILLDAPCSGTGTIRRHPDIKLLLQPELIDQHAQLQVQMLNNLWRTLAPGGTLLYSTCSLLKEENDNVVEQFLSLNNATICALSAPTGAAKLHGWQTLPTDPDTDGFYLSAMQKPL